MKLSDIYGPVQDDLLKVEQSLDDVVKVDNPILAQMLEYVLKGNGKRIRSALTLLSGKSYDYNLDLLVPMASATELLHNATLVHDDIVDNSPLRHGKSTVCRAWDETKALLLGDYLFAKAGRLVASTGNLRAIKLFAQTLMTISGGELRQTAFTFDLKHAREYYYSWIEAKTACLFIMATESGAVLSQSPDDVIEAMIDYGHNFGMAFQIVDDVLDFIGEESVMGKPVGSDLGEGAVTLPAILFAEAHPDSNLIGNVIKHKDPDDVALLVERIRDSTIIDECLAIATDYCSRACRALEVLPDNSARQSLSDLANFVVQRRK